MKIVDLGCGERKYVGSKGDVVIGVDYYDSTSADVKHNLDKFPYPFKDNEFDMVYCSHVIEHVKDPVKFLTEVHRIAKPNALVIVKAPHFSYAWAHGQHRNAIGIGYFETMGVSSKGSWGEKRAKVVFEVLSKKFSWMLSPLGRITSVVFIPMNFVINFFANLNPYVCERVWCYWFGGFEEVEFKLKVLKK